MLKRWMAPLLLALLNVPALAAPPTEDDYYRLIHFPLPDDVVLEVSGLEWLDADRTKLLVCTRRGELWLVENAYADTPALETPAKGKPPADPAQVVRYRLLDRSLHEPLGLLANPGKGFPDGIYTAQRGELTRLTPAKDGKRLDALHTVCPWEISGGYHEYAFGPKQDPEGNLWVTLNVPFGGGQEATAYWRGWAVKIDKTGKMTPVCAGLRSPAGLGANHKGDLFYTDNQGEWVAVCKLSHLKPGSFHGHTTSLESIDHPLSTIKLPKRGFPKSGLPWPEAAKAMPEVMPPAVWFPYPDMGQSHTDILSDSTRGKFGPFADQLFVGDLTRALVLRVFLEQVGGEYQGAVLPFRKGFQPPILRMAWGKDGSLFAGGSSRGWGGGARPHGLARLVWTGKVPFEVHEMRAARDGFTLTFTHPVDRKTAGDPKSYAMQCWTYRLHSTYGDSPQNKHALTIQRATVADDGRSVALVVDGLAPYHVHELRLNGVRSKDDLPLLHPLAYYTLNRIPK